MGKGDRDSIWPGGVGADVFGEEGTARQLVEDRVNDYLRTKHLTEYLDWHKKNG
jgi:hypothetical protein